jgi:restriction system protein
LLGVVSDMKATKGILITTSKFSPEAIKFEKNNPSIELINLSDLMILLNAHLGTYWTNKIDSIINEQKIKNSH